MKVPAAINLVHIFLFAPLLLLLAQYPSLLNDWVRIVVAIVAVVVLSYHASKAINTNNWVNWFHTIVVAPLLIWIAIQGTQMDSTSQQMVTLVAIAAIAYHGWRAFEKLSA